MTCSVTRTAIVFACTAALAGVSSGPVLAQAGAGAGRLPPDLKVVDHIVYKRVGDTRLELMLSLPPERPHEKSPLVVYIHGGGWGGGDRYRVVRKDVIGVVRELNRRGVICASIEYRLADGGKDTVMESVADCLDAVGYLASNAAEYGIDPRRIGTFGSSAGGHLSLMTALGERKEFPCEAGLDGHRVPVRCAVAYYPSTSFVHPELHVGSNFENPRRLVPILGGPLEERRDVAKKLSPVELLTRGSPPLFLVHGDEDAVLSHKHSLFLYERARAKGAHAECLIVQGAGHGLQGDTIRPDEVEIRRRTVEFFLEHLTPK